MKRFILPDTFLKKLSDLAIDYSKRSGTQLKKSEPSFWTPVLHQIGYKNTNVRVDQIEFIDNWRVALKSKLKPLFEFESEEEIQEHIKGLSILYAVCIYIISQLNYNPLSSTLKKPPVLITLLYEAMESQKGNFNDKETLEFSLLAAWTFTDEFETVEKANEALGTTFSEIYWDKFVKYLHESCKNIDNTPNNNYPVTRLMMPLIGLPCKLIGTGIGFVTGDSLGKSVSSYAITAVLGTGVIFTFSVPTSMALLVMGPTFIGKAVDTCFGITTAQFFGSISEVIGKAIGLCVGGTVDLARILLENIRSAINNYLYGDDTLPAVTGFILGYEPRRIVNGIELKFEAQPSNILPLENIKKEEMKEEAIFCNITEKGLLIKSGEKEVFIPKDSNEFPELQTLYKKINQIPFETETSNQVVVTF